MKNSGGCDGGKDKVILAHGIRFAAAVLKEN
jgi:hypothetical protein